MDAKEYCCTHGEERHRSAIRQKSELTKKPKLEIRAYRGLEFQISSFDLQGLNDSMAK